MSVLSWGVCHHNQKEAATPQQVLALVGRSISQLSSGSYCSMALTDAGEVLVAGKIYTPDQFSKRPRNWNNESVNGWWPLHYFTGVRIAQVACGLFFNLFLSEHGEVFSCGQGKRGALGHGDLADRTEPCRIQELSEEKISVVAAGARHACALTFTGNLYSWGSGGQGRLGLGDERDRHCPQLHSEESLGANHPAHIACGFAHTLVLIDNGSVYSFGSGGRGQLGHGALAHLLYPRRLEYLDRERIVHICGGAWHSLALTDCGDVYAWGSSQYGQLGTGNVETCTLPMLVAAIPTSKIAHIAANGVFSAAVTEEGQVYSWGCNNHGQLGRTTLHASNSAGVSKEPLMNLAREPISTNESSADEGSEASANATDFDPLPQMVPLSQPVETLCVGPLGVISLCSRDHLGSISTDSIPQEHLTPQPATPLAIAEYRHLHPSVRDPHSPMSNGIGGISSTVDEATEFEMILFPERYVQMA